MGPIERSLFYRRIIAPISDTSPMSSEKIPACPLPNFEMSLEDSRKFDGWFFPPSDQKKKGGSCVVEILRIQWYDSDHIPSRCSLCMSIRLCLYFQIYLCKYQMYTTPINIVFYRLNYEITTKHRQSDTDQHLLKPPKGPLRQTQKNESWS